MNLEKITMILLIIGGINLGAMAGFDKDFVVMLIGDGNSLIKILYIAIGLSALYHLRDLLNDK